MSAKRFVKIGALLLAITMPIITGITAFAEGEETGAGQVVADPVSLYDSPNINELTGDGKEPEELSVSAGTVYQEKAWYEYVVYSEKAVCSYRLDDDMRLLFYDPYTYTNAMIMDVEFDASTTEFDTMSSYSVSYTNSRTIGAALSSTNTYTEAEQTSGKDTYHTAVANSGTTKTIYNHSLVNESTGTVKNETDYEYKAIDYDTTSFAFQAAQEAEVTASLNPLKLTEGKVTIGLTETKTTDHNTDWVVSKATDSTIYSDNYSASTRYTGDDTVEDNTTSTTDGWTELSARVTKTIGSSRSTSNSWSETESKTVTKTYAATHFASDGVTPLPWAIVHYQVQMPMKCCLQVKYSGEWVTISTVYCMLTTVQGTCRTWMQGGQVFYEDWGNGEPVMETEFWSQFMTREALMEAYSDKLYPVGGVD